MRLNSKIQTNSQEKKAPVLPGPKGKSITIPALHLRIRNIEAGVTRPQNGFMLRMVELSRSVAGDLSKRLEKASLEYLPPREGVTPRRFKKSELEYIVSGNCEAIDLVLMNEVRLAMGTGVSDTVSDACAERQLFPSKLIDALNLTTFLARVAIPARIAQRITGCPASALIADAWMVAPCRLPLGDPDPANDWFRTGESFTSVEASFLDRANVLGRDRRFQGALRSAITWDLDSYIDQLKTCKIWDAQDAAERVAFIMENNIFECDGMPKSDKA
jgi:hypothetical protein